MPRLECASSFARHFAGLDKEAIERGLLVENNCAALEWFLARVTDASAISASKRRLRAILRDRKIAHLNGKKG
jgi:hypothetical protein